MLSQLINAGKRF